ncbi:MAG: cell division protein FtsZ [Sphingomonadales bacterium 63-6]|nr:MAG: cell division protein FtsZ [Sphingomonadales bacterium 63-6]
MSINIGPPSVEELRPRIVVIGVGGAGGNAIANMIKSEIEGVDFIVANTDAQALNNSIAEHRIQLGPDITQGLGAGSRPEVGRAAAEETVEELERALEGVNMVFIAAGMGGGTGTGAAPVIAEAARRKGVLTVGVVTKPFLFEGTRRMRSADSGIDELQKHVDTLIVIPNQNLFLVAKAETTFKEAFALADEVLQQGVRSITDLMVMPGLINLDFADVRSVMGEMGKAMMGTGEAEGENRALQAAERAIANPLLDGVSMQGAKGVIISIIGGEDMKLLEVDEAANHIRELVDPDANIIWGSAFNPDLEGKIRVSVVATGIEQTADQAVQATRPLDLSASRGPKRPVLPLPTQDELAVDAASGFAPAPSPAMPQAYEPSYEDEAYEDTGRGYASLTGDEIQTGELTLEEEEDDGIADDWNAAPPQAGSGSELELTLEAPDAGNGGQDELVLDPSRFAQEEPAAPPPPFGGRRRGLLGGEGGAAPAPAAPPAGGGAAGGPVGGSTLFERMANLSRGAARDAADDDGDDDPSGPSISIPRFLGRQNNQ